MTSSSLDAERRSDEAALSTETPLDDILSLSTRVGDDGTVTLVVVGEVDTFTVALLRSAIAEQLEGEPSELVLDLSVVEFLGSAGLAVLLETRHWAGARNVALRLIATTSVVLRPLQVTGLIDLFTITTTSTHECR